MPGVEAHGHGAARAHARNPLRGPLDVGRVDVAAGHDDDVLDAAADHDVPVLHQVAEVAGVVPAVLVLRGHEAAHGDVARRQRLAAQLDDADAARGQHAAVLVDDARLEILEQRAQRGQPAGVALGRRDRAAQGGQQVGVDLVDHQAGAALGERHRQRGLRHAVGRQDRLRLEPEWLTRLEQVFDVGGFDRFGTGEREAQGRQVELTRLGLVAQPLGEQRVGEVGRRGHGALVLVDELGPQQGVAQEVHRRDLDQLGTEVHRDGEEADHAHVVEAGQPADHDVVVDVVLGADEHRLGVGVDVAVGDDHGLRGPGRAGRQLHQRDVVLTGLHRIGGLVGQQFLDGEDLDAALLQDRDGHQERVGDDDGLGLDHVDDVGGVLGPQLQVGAGGGLVQHGQAGPAHPQRLRRRGDLHRCTGKHTDRVAEADTGGLEATGDAPGTLVHLTPGVPDRLVRFPGDHALGADPGVVEHLVGETAHDDLLGMRSWLSGVGDGAQVRDVMLHPPVRPAGEARQ